MENKIKEDLQDLYEIKKQKEEQKKKNDNMASWTLGNGLKKKRGK